MAITKDHAVELSVNAVQKLERFRCWLEECNRNHRLTPGETLSLDKDRAKDCANTLLSIWRQHLAKD